MPPLRAPTRQATTRLAPQTKARPLVPLRAPPGSSRAACFAPEAAAAGIYTLEAPPRLLDLDLAPPSPPSPSVVVAPPPPSLDTEEPAPIVELTPDNFQDYLKDRDIVVVDFYTDWCGPCKVMSKEFDKFPKAFKTVAFAKMNCGKGHEEFATRHRIRSLPTFRLYRRGLFVEEITGGRPVQLRQMVLHHSLR